MKKVIILSCVCMIFITACTLDGNVQSDIDNNSKSTQTYGMNKNTENVSSGDSKTSNNPVQGDSNIGSDDENVSSVELDSRLESLQNDLGYYQDMVHLSEIDGAIYALGLPLTQEKLDKIEDQSIRGLLEEIVSRGYLIVDQEDFYTVKIDFEKLMDLSRPAAGPARDYVELNYYFDAFGERLLSRSPVNMDELVSMIIRIEKHIETWPDSAYKNDLNRLYKNQLVLYFLGNEAYPVFDFNTNKVIESRLALMKKHMELYLESDFAKIGMKYLFKLESKEYAYHPEYIQLIENFKRFGLESNLKLVEKKILDHKESIFLPELSGHNNVTIQESINQILREEVENQKKATGFDEATEGSFYFNTYVYTANERHLSIECMGTNSMKDWTLDKSVVTAFNFDLATGEPLTLSRLLKQGYPELDGWMLKIVNDELVKYFGEDSKLETLENANYLIQDKALLIIGRDPTHRAYIPKWMLKDYVDLSDVFL